MPEAPYTAHVISHTHWDREWYRTFEVFRMRLVDVLDALLNLLDQDPTYGPFYLDGQMRPVEDYVEVRPENAERLRRAFASGRLYAGPWYVQPDEFLVSGEAIVRNLLLGRRTAAAWATGAAIGYAPDAFGHISQMPQLLRGFGIDNAVLFRGITADQVPANFEWRSPDGSSVLCIKLPDDNAYSNWFYRFRQTLADTDRGVPLEVERVIQEGSALLEDSLAERPMTRYILWMDGVDHIFPQPRTPEIIRILNERMGDRVRVRAASLREHVDAVLAEARDLPVVTGELRVANRKWKLQALLAHVASSRMHLKQRNHACEILLERWAEPFSALVWMLAKRFGPPGHPDRLPEHTASSPAAMLRYAWKTLLLNQPHDSICGCSIDQVHRDMLARFDAVDQVGEAITARSLSSLAGWIRTEQEAPTAAEDHEHHDRPDAIAALVVFNPLSWHRSGELVDAVLHVPQDGAPASVGVWDGDRSVPCLVEDMPDCHTLTQAPHDIPVGMAWKRFRLRFVADVPAFGYKVYHVARRAVALPVPGRSAIEAGSKYVSNGVIRVNLADDGTLTMRDLRTGLSYEGLAALEDGGDFGDGYNYIPPRHDMVLCSSEPPPRGSDWTAEVTATPMEGCITVHHRWFIPAGRDGETRDATTQTPMDITIRAIVRPESARLDFDIRVDNQARDHRLRILFPSGANGASHYAVEQAYDVASRPISLPDCTGWKELQPRTGPQKSWCDVSDGAKGLCVMNMGLPECEVLDDEQRTVAVTLIRCTGGGVGLPEEQVDGQMLGVYTFRLAVLPHKGSWYEAHVWKEAHAFNVPMRAAQTGLHGGPLEPADSFVDVAPDDLVLTALKVAEDESGVVIRAVNLGHEAVEARLSVCAGDLGAPVRVRLDEEPCEGGMQVRPREIFSAKFHATQE